MSRTYRRKNFIQENNTSWDRKYCRQLGHWVDYSCESRELKPVDGYRQWYYTHIYYEPVGRELWEKKRWAHGESKTGNSRSPGKWTRKHVNKEAKTHNNREYHKWLNSAGEYDPVFMESARSCYWDWD